MEQQVASHAMRQYPHKYTFSCCMYSTCQYDTYDGMQLEIIHLEMVIR